MSIASQSLWMLANRILMAPLSIVIGSLILWLVSHIMKFSKRNFLTAILTSLILFVFNTLLGILYNTLLLFAFKFNMSNINPINISGLILTSLIIFILHVLVSSYIIKNMYDTTGRRAIGAYFIYLIISMAIGLIVMLLIFLAGASIFSSFVSKFTM